jgi:hypothetical protein
MPTFDVELEDGRILEIDADREPTQDEIYQSLGYTLDTRQSLAGSMGSSAGRGLLGVPKGMVGGLGDIASLVPGLEDNPLQRGAEAFESAYSEALPVNPANEGFFPVKAANAIGQAGGMLATSAGSVALKATPAVARAVALGTAGLLGAEQGGDIADQYGMTDWTDRAASIVGGGATEAATESLGGIGGGTWTRNWVNRAKSAMQPGSALLRFGKTAGIEGVEEIIAGEARDQLTKGIVEEDPERPGFALNGQPLPADFLSMDTLKNRLEEGALGAIGGSVFAGVEALNGRTEVDEALGLRLEAQNAIKDLQSRSETLSEAEQTELAQLQQEDENLSAWLNRQGTEKIRPVVDALMAEPATFAESLAKYAEDAGRTEDAARWRSPEGIQEASEALTGYATALQQNQEAPTPETQEAVDSNPLHDIFNPTSPNRQRTALDRSYEERKAQLQERTKAAQQAAGVSKADAATVEIAANTAEAGAPQTAEALVEATASLPTETKAEESEAAPQPSPVRFNTRFTGQSQGPLETREMADPEAEVYKQGTILPEGYQGPQIEQTTPVERQTRHRVFEGGSPISVPSGPNVLDARDETNAYRVTTQPQIDDILATGQVRSKEGKIKGGRTGETQWSRGHPSLGYRSDQGRYVIVAPAEGLQDRQGGLPLSEVSRIFKAQDGGWVDVTEEIKSQKPASSPPSPLQVAQEVQRQAQSLIPQYTGTQRLVAQRNADVLTKAIQKEARKFAGVNFADTPGGARMELDGTISISVPILLDRMSHRTERDASRWIESVLDEEFRHRVSIELAQKDPAFQADLELLYDALPEEVKEMSRAAYFAQVDARLPEGEPVNQFSNPFIAQHEFFRQYWQNVDVQRATESALASKGLLGKLRSLIAKFIRELRRIQKGLVDPNIKAMLDRLIAQAESKAKELQSLDDTTSTPIQELDQVPGQTVSPQATLPSGSPQFGTELSTASEIPPRPEAPVSYDERGTGNTTDEVLDSLWRPFYATWEANRTENGLPLDQAQLAADWQDHISDSDYLFNKDLELMMEKRNRGREPGLYSPEPTQTPSELSTAPSGTDRLQEIADRFSYEPSTTQQEGQTPAQATKDQRTYSDGTPVEMYREGGISGPLGEKWAGEAIDLLINQSPDGPSMDFGRELMGYIRGTSDEWNGLRESNTALRMNMARSLVNDVQQRNVLGIQIGDLRLAMQKMLTTSGKVLQSAANFIYQPLQKMAEKAKELATTKADQELGSSDFVGMAKEANESFVKDTKDNFTENLTDSDVKEMVMEEAQNEVDAMDYSFALEELGPEKAQAFQDLIAEIASLDEELRQLAELESLSTPPSTAASAREQVRSKKLTVEELRKSIEARKKTIGDLMEKIQGVKTTGDVVEQARTKVRAAKKKKQAKVTNNASFRDWVGGAETADLAKFNDLMKKYIQASGFNREAFTTLLTNKFPEADPDFINKVVYGFASVLDGAATEEGVTESAPVNYDARAKRIVAKSLSEGSTAPKVEQVDPLNELTGKRLKGEISVKQFQEEAKKLGIGEDTVFALLQKVDLDRARIGDTAAQRQMNAEAKKGMKQAREAAEREAQKFEKEALREIQSASAQFVENSPQKKPAASDLKLLKDSFLGKNGPPIPESEFLSKAAELNIKPETAQKLAQWLSASRRADAMEKLQKALQRAAKAKQKAVESMVKKLSKVKSPDPRKARQRSQFVSAILGAMETGILEEDAVRDSFAHAYDLHGLTNERLKELGQMLQDIEKLPEGMVKETLYNEFSVLLNDLAPSAQYSKFAHEALMGYVLGGINTMVMQVSGINRYLNPLSGTLNVLWRPEGTIGQKIGRTLGGKYVPMGNFFRVYFQGINQLIQSLPQIANGITGIIDSKPTGIGAMPTGLQNIRVHDTSMSYTPVGQISKFRFEAPKLFEKMGLSGLVNLTKYPAWMASRSFQVIRAAEGLVGSADRNMQWRSQMTEALMKGDNLSWAEAYSRVSDALGDKTAELWKDAKAQAKLEYDSGLLGDKKDVVSKTILKVASKGIMASRANEIVQQKLEEQWGKKLENRDREQAALLGFKQDPLTPLGAAAYKGVARILNRDQGALKYAKFSFLFARFFVNAIETAYFNSPLGFTGGLMLPKSLKKPADEREQNIERIYGSVKAYREARLAQAVSGTAVLGAVGALMVAAFRDWDPEDEDPPWFAVSGDPLGEFQKKGMMESTGWWKPNTLYLGPLRINYVNTSPEMAMTLSVAGNLSDRFIFDKLLNYRTNPQTDEKEFSAQQAMVTPVLEATIAPMTRSTYRHWVDAIEQASDGKWEKASKLITSPVTGTATALSPLGLIPSVKSFEKLERQESQPKTPKSITQAAAGNVPFADSLGLDRGKPLVTPFGDPLTPFSYLSMFTNEQEVDPEVGKAARTLANMGLSPMGPEVTYHGGGIGEISVDGKRYLLNDEERAVALHEIGMRFAKEVNRNEDRLRRLEAKEGRKKVSAEVSALGTKAKTAILRKYKPERKKPNE